MAIENENRSNKSTELPHELIVEEILWRLPVKLLLRFRSVCKSWKSLISSPHFTKLHLNNSTQSIRHQRIMLNNGSVHSLDYEGSTEPLTLDCPTDHNRPYSRGLFWGSCNGLLCVSPNKDVILLWNSSTRKSKKLPDLPSDFPSQASQYPPFGYGLGYDSSVDDYIFFSFIRCFKMVAKVYSLRANSWRLIQDFPYNIYCINPLGLYVNEALHWRVGLQNGPSAILSFNIREEKYGLVPLPEINMISFGVGALGDCLCIYHHSYNGKQDVLVMKEYGVRESWTKIITIPCLDQFMSRPFLRWLLPLKSGEVAFLMTNEHQVVLYKSMDPTSRSFVMPKLCEAVTYVESLISPDGNNGGVEDQCDEALL